MSNSYFTTCSVNYTHQVKPSASDVGPDVNLPGGCWSDRNTLGKALRQAGVLAAGARLTSFRTEGDKVHCFPSMPGLTTYWHCITLTLHDETTHALPNFAKLTQPDLMAFWFRYSRAIRLEAGALLGHTQPGFTNVVANLANYACNLAVVMRCEADGDTRAADIYRSHVKLCLERLPEDLQAAIRGMQA